jgi:hypothetical protein
LKGNIGEIILHWGQSHHRFSSMAAPIYASWDFDAESQVNMWPYFKSPEKSNLIIVVSSIRLIAYNTSQVLHRVALREFVHTKRRMRD